MYRINRERPRLSKNEQELASMEWLGPRRDSYLNNMALFLSDCFGVGVSTKIVLRILYRCG
jgi:hypothetical protein